MKSAVLHWLLMSRKMKLLCSVLTDFLFVNFMLLFSLNDVLIRVELILVIVFAQCSLLSQGVCNFQKLKNIKPEKNSHSAFVSKEILE